MSIDMIIFSSTKDNSEDKNNVFRKFDHSDQMISGGCIPCLTYEDVKLYTDILKIPR